MTECKCLYKTDIYSSFCTEITTVLPDKNSQRPLLNIITYSGRHHKRHLENTKLLNHAKVHHSDSCKAMPTEHNSVRKKTLEHNSRSNLFLPDYGDDVIDYGAVDLYWGRCGRIWRCRSFWGRCGRVCRCRSLLGTFW